MENDTDGMHEVGMKFHVQTLQHEVNNTYFKDLSNDNNLNADSKILNIPDKILHCKTTGYLAEGEQSVSKKHQGMGKENLANGQGRFYLPPPKKTQSFGS